MSQDSANEIIQWLQSIGQSATSPQAGPAVSSAQTTQPIQPPATLGVPLGGGPLPNIPAYESSWGKTSVVPYTKQNLAADVVGNVMNAWMGYKATQKAKEQQTAQSAFQLIDMGYPADVVLNNPKVFKAIEKTLNIELPKDTEGHVVPPKEPFAKQADTAKTSYLQGQLGPDVQRRMSDLGLLPGDLESRVAQMKGQFGIGEQLLRGSQQLQEGLGKTKMSLYEQMPQIGPKGVADVADYLWGISKQLPADTLAAITSNLDKQQQELQKMYVPMLEKAFPDLSSDPGRLTILSSIAARGKGMSTQLTEGLKAADLLPGKSGQPVNMTSKLAAVDYLNKQLEAKSKELGLAETGQKMQEKGLDIAGKKLMLTSDVTVNGMKMPMYLGKIAVEISETQARYEKLKQQMPNLDVAMKAIDSGRLDQESKNALVVQMAHYLGYSATLPEGARAFLAQYLGWSWLMPTISLTNLEKDEKLKDKWQK